MYPKCYINVHFVMSYMSTVLDVAFFHVADPRPDRKMTEEYYNTLSSAREDSVFVVLLRQIWSRTRIYNMTGRHC
jgi:hypothetical protein